MPAIPYKKTGTKDGTWSASEAEKNLKSVEADLRMCFAWVDPNGNADAKGSYKFPHHFVASDGVVGDASVAACHSAIAVLNGGMGGADIPEGDKQGVYDHVAHHLRDAGIVPAEMKSAPRADHRHAAFSGTHTHSHAAMGSQGGDETHTHEHSHDEDHDHSHHKTEGKSARAFAKGTERRQRSASGLEIRSGDAGALTFEGYAAVTGVPTVISDWMGEFQETISRGAFAKTLAESDDVRLLLNHAGTPMARTKSGTLALEEDAKGLHARASLDESSPLVQEIASAMRRGDLDQMSFQFQAMRQEWNADYTQRSVNEAKLFDVSIVTYPAYPTTSASLRSAVTDPHLQIRLAYFAHELREGKTFSSANMKQLTDLLDALAQIDTLTDEWQPKLAEMIGVPDPDHDDDTKSDDRRSSWLSPTIAAALALAKR